MTDPKPREGTPAANARQAVETEGLHWLLRVFEQNLRGDLEQLTRDQAISKLKLMKIMLGKVGDA
jgi:hypothetical protein